MNAIGIIPAAGKGTRLGLPYPKELLPVSYDNSGVITVLESNLIQLAEAGIHKAVIVISPEKEVIRNYLGSRRHNVDLEYTYQVGKQSQEGLPDAVLAAKHLAGDQDIYVMLMGDVYFSWKYAVRDMIESMTPYNDAAVATWKTYEPSRFGVVTSVNDKLKKVTDKPQDAPVPSYFWGATAFRKSFWWFLQTEEQTFSHALNDYAIEHSIRVMAARGLYLDLGTPQSLISGIIDANYVGKI